MLHGENMPPEFARSADWFLSAISIGVGLELIIEYSPFMGDAGISADPGTDCQDCTLSNQLSAPCRLGVC